MTTEELIHLVRKMRRLQKEWFRLSPADRPPALIGQAKAAERAVDKAINAMESGQMSLFPEEDPPKSSTMPVAPPVEPPTRIAPLVHDNAPATILDVAQCVACRLKRPPTLHTCPECGSPYFEIVRVNKQQSEAIWEVMEKLGYLENSR